jgi:hypothetical protein
MCIYTTNNKNKSNVRTQIYPERKLRKTNEYTRKFKYYPSQL